MIKNKDGTWCAISEIIGNDKQLTATISNPNWKYFEVGSKVKVISINGSSEFYRRIRLIGNGKQRNISIPREEWTNFNKGDKIKIFPEKQPKVSKSQENSINEQNDKSIHSKEHMP